MKNRPRVVVDTNVLVSRLLRRRSLPAQAVDRIIQNAQLLVSEETMKELARVLSRRKFDRYIVSEERVEFIRELSTVVEMVPIVHRIHVCRDARDDKFLEVAVNGSAQLIVTGDIDLLALHPFREIAILSPADYLRL
ncbi:MAG TPA: putative toxin-antitoxin system toxin component, PIN family [Edaphobacter sp.]